MKKIVDFGLSYSAGGRGRIQFRLEGEETLRSIDLDPAQFAVVATVLAHKEAYYDIASRSFISHPDNHTFLAIR